MRTGTIFEDEAMGRVWAPDLHRLRAGVDSEGVIRVYYRFAQDRQLARFLGMATKGHPFGNSSFVKLLKQEQNEKITECMKRLHIADPTEAAGSGPLPKRSRSEMYEEVPEVTEIKIPAVEDVDEICMRVLSSASLKAPVYFELTTESVEFFKLAGAADYSEFVSREPASRSRGCRVNDDEGQIVVNKILKLGRLVYYAKYYNGNKWCKMQLSAPRMSDPEQQLIQETIIVQILIEKCRPKHIEADRSDDDESDGAEWEVAAS